MNEDRIIQGTEEITNSNKGVWVEEERISIEHQETSETREWR